MPDYLDKLLQWDPMGDAVDITRCDLTNQDDPNYRETVGIAWHKLRERESELRRVLTERNDTYRRMPIDEFVRVAEGAGLTQQIEIPFHTDTGDQRYLVHASIDEGLVLTVTTYGETQVNSATVYFNWKPALDPNGKFVNGYRAALDAASGGFDSPTIDDPPHMWTFAGSIGAEEALAYRLDKLRCLGTFVSPWTYSPRFRLVHYGDGHRIDSGLEKYRTDCNVTSRSRLPLISAELHEVIRVSTEID